MMFGRMLTSDYSLLMLPSLVFLSLFVALGYDGFYGQDAYAYLNFSDAINEKGIDTIWRESFFWPKLYSSLGGIVSFLTIPTTFALCFISAISLGLSAVFTRKTLLNYNVPPQFATWIVILGIILAPYLLRSGLSAMSDSLMVCLVSLFFLLDSRYRLSESLNGFLALSSVAVLIFNTRYVGILICAPLLLFYVIKAFKKKQYIQLILGCLILSVPILQYLQSTSNGLSSHYFLDSWSIKNWFLSSFEGGERPFNFELINILHSLKSIVHPGYSLIVAPLVLVAVIKRIKPDLMVITSALIYILFIAGIPFQNDRFLIVIPILMIIALRDAIPAGFEMLAKLKHPAIVLTSLIGIVFSVLAMRTPISVNQTERKLADYINKNSYDGVICFEVDVALESRLRDVTVYSLWDLDTLQSYKGLHLILDDESVRDAWEGTIVDKNLSHLKLNYHLHLINEIGSFKDYILE